MENNALESKCGQKPVVLTMLNSYLPGYKSGGPLKSMTNLVDRLGDRFSFRIVCSDRDLGDHSSYPGIKHGEWARIGKADVYYLPPGKQKRIALHQILRTECYDLVYCNSFFNFSFSCYPMLLRRFGMIPNTPIVLAPRGEFSQGAIAIKSAKKKLYRAVCRSVGVHRNIVWQATSQLEIEDIRRVMGYTARHIHLATNLGSLTNVIVRFPQRLDFAPLKIIYLSRIVPKKNLLTVIQTLSHVTSPISFDIYGPIEDEDYWQQCQREITQLPSHVSVKYCGALHPDHVHQQLLGYDLFFLPTRGENYGHVIVEAFQAGLPVLISDQTPWRGLEQLGIGKDCSLSAPEEFANYIHKISALSPTEHLQIRRKALEYGQSIATADDTINQYIELFESAIKLGKQTT